MSVTEHLHFRGLSQSEVARRLRVSPSNFCLICNGRRSLAVDKVPELAEILGHPIADIVTAFTKVRKNYAKRQ